MVNAKQNPIADTQKIKRKDKKIKIKQKPIIDTQNIPLQKIIKSQRKTPREEQRNKGTKQQSENN